MYSTIPKYDVSVHSTQRGVACVLCTFADMMEHAWVAESTQEMVDHLAAHVRTGDRVPEDITEALWRDNATNYPRSQIN